MKKFIKLSMLSLALMLALSLPFSSIQAASASNELLDETRIESCVGDEGFETFEIMSSLGAPRFIATRGLYNCAVQYTWVPGSGSNKLRLTRHYAWTIYQIKEGTYTSWSMGDPGLSGRAESEFFLGKTINDSGGESTQTDMSWDEKISDIAYTVRYGAKPKYEVKGKTSAGYMVMPTKWDQPGFVWTHGASRNTLLRGTFRYGSVLQDIEVKVPLLGYATQYITISGVRFEFRTGPNKCSIRTTSNNIMGFDFAFGTHKPTNDVWPNLDRGDIINPNTEWLQV